MIEKENGSAPPAAGIRILEFSGLGPTPFGAMLLADLGADILRIERFGA
ncbi:MAG: CoA transferase, partial [Sphingopyxis terrae]